VLFINLVMNLGGALFHPYEGIRKNKIFILKADRLFKRIFYWDCLYLGCITFQMVLAKMGESYNWQTFRQLCDLTILALQINHLLRPNYNLCLIFTPLSHNQGEKNVIHLSPSFIRI